MGRINVRQRIQKNNLKRVYFRAPFASLAKWGLTLLALVLGDLLANGLALLISRPAMMLIGITAFISVISSYRQEKAHRLFSYFVDPLIMMSMSTALVATWSVTFDYSSWALFMLSSSGLLLLGLNQDSHLLPVAYPLHLTVSLLLIYSLTLTQLTGANVVALAGLLGLITVILGYCLRPVIRLSTTLLLVSCVGSVGWFCTQYIVPGLTQAIPFK